MISQHRSKLPVRFIIGGVLLIGLGVLLLKGRGLGLWRILDVTQALLDHRAVSQSSHGDYTNLIFLHHSVGHNLIEDGGVRAAFTTAGYDFWDHGYNWHELRDPAGKQRGYSYNIPDDNTNPSGFARIFAQKLHTLPLNAFSGLLQHEVIAFKSCFPVSNITSDAQLAQYKNDYREVRNVLDEHHDKLFIIVTPPPLNPAGTNAAAAARARAFAEWLQSAEYLSGHPNLATFDLFGYLAEDDPTAPDFNMLRQNYREGEDSHPNHLANEKIGPLFVKFSIEVIEHYRE